MALKKLTLYGQNFEENGENQLFFPAPHLTLGISPGWSTPYVTKTHPNEDCLCTVVIPEMTFLAIADGHWGREASHQAVAVCKKRFENWANQGTYQAVQLQNLFEEVEREICHLLLAQGKQGETALLVVVIHHEKKTMDLAEYGDCICMMATAEGGKTLTRPLSSWLGLRSYRAGLRLSQSDEGLSPFGLKTHLRIISIPLVEPSYILICTDGVTECIYGVETITPDLFSQWINQHPAMEDLAKRVMHESLRRDRKYRGHFDRGGEDNIGFALVQI